MGLFATLLTVLFIGLKLAGKIAWSWGWVLAPVWITAILWVIFIGLFAMGVIGTSRRLR